MALSAFRNTQKALLSSFMLEHKFNALKETPVCSLFYKLSALFGDDAFHLLSSHTYSCKKEFRKFPRGMCLIIMNYFHLVRTSRVKL